MAGEIVDPVTPIVGALAAGALAGVKGLASEAVKTAYGELKTLIVSRLKRNAPVESFEEAPTSSSAREALVGSLKEAGADTDLGVKQLAEKLAKALEDLGSEKLQSADIDIGVIEAYRHAIVADIEASGKIAIQKMTASTGDAVVSGLRAGDQQKKKCSGEGR